jgi:Host cell surface-exposed lipoprotein
MPAAFWPQPKQYEQSQPQGALMRRIATLTAIAVAGITLAACEVEEPGNDTAADRSAVVKKAKKKAKKKSEPQFSVAQENALSSGQAYIDMSGFSREGLIKQLKFEGFSKADAAFAAGHVDVSWRKEAAESAEAYMDTSSFSAEGLRQQLEFEGFTAGQANYALDAVGY